MIGKIKIGKSFRGCICYCLEDKRELAEKTNRAEVLAYNLCYGDKKELINQFNEVRDLNPKLSKPVMHLTLSLSPKDTLDYCKMTTLAEECAKSLGFEKNQWLAISHNDTKHQHLHLVVNRIGFDGKTLSDSNNYRKIATFCRAMERKYYLEPVLSPRRFLPRELRNIERLDSRKELLRKNITNSLFGSTTFGQFEKQMNKLGYQLLKARGIAFIDSKKIRIKGSEVGYSLSRIERTLMRQATQKIEQHQSEMKEKLSYEKSQKTDLKSVQEFHFLEIQFRKSILNDLLMNYDTSKENTHPNIPKKRKKLGHRYF